jgi:hypothetical protein
MYKWFVTGFIGTLVLLSCTGCVTIPEVPDCNKLAADVMETRQSGGATFMGSASGPGWTKGVFFDPMGKKQYTYLIIKLDKEGKNHAHMTESEPVYSHVANCVVPIPDGEPIEAGMYLYVETLDTQAAK